MERLDFEIRLNQWKLIDTLSRFGHSAVLEKGCWDLFVHGVGVQWVGIAEEERMGIPGEPLNT